MKNILFCSVGRRGKLLQNFKEANTAGKVLATDCSPYAPALYFADKHFIGPRIDDKNYLDFIFELCKKEEADLLKGIRDFNCIMLRSAFIDELCRHIGNTI